MKNSTIKSQAATVLAEMIAAGVLASQYPAFVLEKEGNSQSSYNKVKASQGEKAAKEWLEKWNREDRMSDYAAAIEPLARSMLAVALADSTGQYVRLADLTDNSLFPRAERIVGKSQMIVLLNCPDVTWGKITPAGASDWSSSGRLGLKAVTLEWGYSLAGERVVQMGLVLPDHLTSDAGLKGDSFSVITINLQGLTGFRSRSATFLDNGLLLHALGLSDLEGAMDSDSVNGGPLHWATGFSDAVDYVADALPKLGQYFADLAKCLALAGQ
jgi:hypothetical protein